jgi:hypothetical protein
VKRLNGMDALLLYSETPNLHTHTLKIAIVDAAEYPGEFNYEVFRSTFSGRLHLLDPLRYQLVEIPWRLHHPMWLEIAMSILITTCGEPTCRRPAADENWTSWSARSQVLRWTDAVHCGSFTSPKAWRTRSSR